MSKLRKGIELVVTGAVGLLIADILAHPLGGRPRPSKTEDTDARS